MFIEKRIKKIKGNVQVVPFCQDCDSQDIETVRTCKKCGSYNITVDWMDERSAKQLYNEKEVYVYKCDRCGKEFEGQEVLNTISYCDGEFKPYKSEFNEGFKCINYHIGRDLCEDCKQIVTDILNTELLHTLQEDHIETIIKAFVGRPHLEDGEIDSDIKITNCNTCKKLKHCRKRRDTDLCLDYDPQT